MSWQKRSKVCAGLPTSAILWSDGRRLGSFPALHLGEQGMLLQGRAPAPVGEPLELELTFAGGEALRLPVLVTRQGYPEDGDLFALLFAGLAEPAQQVIAAAVRAGIEEASGATALVVDDSPEVCAALRRELGRLGYTVAAVTSIGDATRLLERDNSLAVALVDLFLVEDDGRDLLVQLAAEHPGVRRILMSGELALSRVPRIEQVAHGVLVKPWTRAALADLLADAPKRAA